MSEPQAHTWAFGFTGEHDEETETGDGFTIRIRSTDSNRYLCEVNSLVMGSHKLADTLEQARKDAKLMLTHMRFADKFPRFALVGRTTRQKLINDVVCRLFELGYTKENPATWQGTIPAVYDVIRLSSSMSNDYYRQLSTRGHSRFMYETMRLHARIAALGM